MDSDASSSIVRLNIGGKKFCTSVDTLTQREPNSMLAAMFSGRHMVCNDSEKGYVFVDRDGKHFWYILNWLRDGVARNLSELELLVLLELLREAEYYQLLGLVDKINEVLNKKEDDDQMNVDLTRTGVIKYVRRQYFKQVGLRGTNLAGIDLSKLDLSDVDFSFACLKNVNFSEANLRCAKFEEVDAENAIFNKAKLNGCVFTSANLRGALLTSSDLSGAHLSGCCLCDADLRYATLQDAYMYNAKLKGANLVGTCLVGVNLNGVDLSETTRRR